MIKDENGIEVANPDLELGYLVDDEEIIIHEAVAEIPAKYERIPVSLEDGEYIPADKPTGLWMRTRVQPFVPGKPERHEVVKFQRYKLYTPEELAEREQQRRQEEEARVEAEKAAAEAAAIQEERNAIIDATPDALMELAANQEAQEEAIVELAALLAGEE